MHPGTQAFNADPENARLADEYAIVMGTSHCEQMLRNNEDEWKKAGIYGDFNYLTNRRTMMDYWEDQNNKHSFSFCEHQRKNADGNWMAQSCSYTDEYGNKTTGEPKAKIKLSVAQDTVWTKTQDELKTFAAKDGGTSSEQAATQKFGSELQKDVDNVSSETPEVEVESAITTPYSIQLSS